MRGVKREVTRARQPLRAGQVHQAETALHHSAVCGVPHIDVEHEEYMAARGFAVHACCGGGPCVVGAFEEGAQL